MSFEPWIIKSEVKDNGWYVTKERYKCQLCNHIIRPKHAYRLVIARYHWNGGGPVDKSHQVLRCKSCKSLAHSRLNWILFLHVSAACYVDVPCSFEELE